MPAVPAPTIQRDRALWAAAAATARVLNSRGGAAAVTLHDHRERLRGPPLDFGQRHWRRRRIWQLGLAPGRHVVVRRIKLHCVGLGEANELLLKNLAALGNGEIFIVGKKK